MIVFSNAVPKSASTLVANQQCGLLNLTGLKSGQDALIHQMGGRYIEVPSASVMARLVYVSALYGDCVVKCHWGRDRCVSAMLRSGIARMTLCYRDPRDIVLSAMDHGRRSRQGKDPAKAFAALHSLEDAIEFTRRVISQFEFWFDHPGVHLIRYEDLMRDQASEIREMCDFLRWPVHVEAIDNAVQQEALKRKSSWNFNKGTTFRYREEMTVEQISVCNNVFAGFIARLGYDA